ncbi:MAG: sugar ABC transporter ATP-binding protein [Phycisphaerae bacterium]
MTSPPLPRPSTSEPSAARLRMQGIRKRFDATQALAGVDLAVNAGEVLALVGENGAGKSTLMKILSGAYRPDEGHMWLDGQPYSPGDPMAARRAGVAMIYQELSLARHLSVMENILLGIEPRLGPFMDWRRTRQIAADAMTQIGRPDIPLTTPVGRLSIAEQQLVEIARATATGSKVVVLDEPTSSLTAHDIVGLFKLIRRLRCQGQAIIYISHFLEEVREISDRFVVLRDGQSVGGGSTAEAATDHIISLMVGRKVEDLYPRSLHQPGETVLAAQNLSGENKPTRASLELHRGEVLGIAGLVGAGRTELLRTIFGLDAVTSGQVKVGLVSGASSRPAIRWSQGMGMLSEDRKAEGLAIGLSLADNITLSRLGWLVRPSRTQAIARQWISKLNIRCAGPAQVVVNLSGGNQQKVAIARLLYHGVDVLLLDEPTRGIDVGSKAEIYKLIDELAKMGKAVIVVSSYLPELMGICDRIAVMCRGQLHPARPVSSLTEESIMLEATGAAA